MFPFYVCGKEEMLMWLQIKHQITFRRLSSHKQYHFYS